MKLPKECWANEYNETERIREIQELVERERKKMGKALRMKEICWFGQNVNTEQPFIETVMSGKKLTIHGASFNQAVKQFNQKIDNYLKGKE